MRILAMRFSAEALVTQGHRLSQYSGRSDWGFENSARVEGPDEQKRAAFEKVFRQIMTPMHAFVSPPLSLLEKQAIQQETSSIGHTAVDPA